jgi:excisionase family DNA binding protein
MKAGRPKGSKNKEGTAPGSRIIAPVMTVAEVCDYLRIARSTLYHMVKHGEIPYFNIGSDYRFNREEIEEWMKRGK